MSDRLGQGFRGARQFSAWHPEWPLAVGASIAWVLLVAGSSPAAATSSSGHSHEHGHMVMPAAPTLLSRADLTDWMVMAAAMMLPITLPAGRYVATNSIRGRRLRALAVYTVAYLLVWTAFGAVALTLVHLIWQRESLPRSVVLIVVALAGWWQISRWHRRAARSCRRTVPLPLAGGRADLACAWFGLRQGGRCLVSCGHLMAAMALIGGGLVIMPIITAALLLEQRLPVNWTRRVRWRLLNSRSPARPAN